MSISTGCFFRAVAGLMAYDGLRIASLFIETKEDRRARDFLVAAKTSVDRALKAELMEKDVAHTIMEGINDTFDALDGNDYKKATDSATETANTAMDEAMQQVIKCEFERR